MQRLFNCANAIESLKCLQCANFETHNLTYLNDHFKVSHTLPKRNEKLYYCRSCSFQTHSNLLLLRHKFCNQCLNNEKIKTEMPERTGELHFREKHDADPLTLKWFKCSYETLGSSLLEIHTNLKHFISQNDTNPGHRAKIIYKFNRKSHQCGLCSYEAKLASNLKRHIQLRHTDLDKIQWFHCEHCSHKSKTKANLARHTYDVHGKKESFKCGQCPYKTNSKFKLKIHILAKHTQLDSTEWLCCERCSYKTVIKINFQKHVMRFHR